jgi:hypothetical protein
MLFQTFQTFGTSVLNLIKNYIIKKFIPEKHNDFYKINIANLDEYHISHNPCIGVLIDDKKYGMSGVKIISQEFKGVVFPYYYLNENMCDKKLYY